MKGCAGRLVCQAFAVSLLCLGLMLPDWASTVAFSADDALPAGQTGGTLLDVHALPSTEPGAEPHPAAGSASNPAEGADPAAGSASSPAEGAEPAGGSTETPAEAQKRAPRLAFVCPFLDKEYWAGCVEGMQRADRELGSRTEVFSGLEQRNYAERIVGYMKEALATKPDGILIYGGVGALVPLIAQAKEAGIPVITVDSDAPSSARTAYVGSINYELGFYAGECLVKFTGGKGKVGILVSSRSSAREMEVVDAFRDSISDYDMEVISLSETDAIPEVAERKTKEMLAAHPEITAMFCTAGYNIVGAARAKEALKKNKLVLLGFDDVEENLRLVRKGVINGVIVQRPYQMGYWAVRLMNEYLSRGSLAKQVFSVGFILVSQKNIDTYKNEERSHAQPLPTMDTAR